MINDYPDYQNKWLAKHKVEVGTTVVLARGWQVEEMGYRKGSGMPINYMIGRRVKVVAINRDSITVEIESKLDKTSFKVPCFALEEV